MSSGNNLLEEGIDRFERMLKNVVAKYVPSAARNLSRESVSLGFAVMMGIISKLSKGADGEKMKAAAAWGNPNNRASETTNLSTHWDFVSGVFGKVAGHDIQRVSVSEEDKILLLTYFASFYDLFEIAEGAKKNV